MVTFKAVSQAENIAPRSFLDMLGIKNRRDMLYVAKPFRRLFGLGQRMQVFDGVNELGQAHEQIIRDSVPKVSVY